MTDENSENNQLVEWFNSSCRNVLDGGLRLAFILCGTKNWGLSVAESLLSQVEAKSVLVVSETIAGAIDPAKARTQLGRESDAILFDAIDVFDADGFGAVSGTLRGGGLFIVLIPPENEWVTNPVSRFRQRALTLFQHHQAVCFLQQDEPLPRIRLKLQHQRRLCDWPEPYRTSEQQQVVKAIIENAFSAKPVPLVLTSDRGRGKSSALGLAAGYLLEKGVNNIIVTAPRLTSSEPVFRHAQQVIPAAETDRGALVYNEHVLRFMAPDVLLEENPETDLLLVDEAAAIPLPMLEQLLNHYPHVVFATTIHGYEGTGRGFVLKFNKILDSFNPHWQQLSMHTPVRWEEDDPVEQWVDQLLCLDAELPDVPAIQQIELDHCTVNQLDRDELINNEEKLSSLFALLVYAHYRTQPSDLKHMLDDSKVRIYTLEQNKNILAALLVNEEGGFDKELSSLIYKGQRRPEGHLLAQTLTFHAGAEFAATLKYARIMRIAVHPQLQGNGLGTYLLKAVMEQEQQQGVDAIGSSFGATVALLRFWQHTGFETVRMGFTRDHASGTHSAVVLRPFTIEGEKVFQETRKRFLQSLSDWLQEPLADLGDELKAFLGREEKVSEAGLSETDWQDINSYIATHRGYEACMSALHKLVEMVPAHLAELAEQDRAVIVARVCQRQNWAETVKRCGFSGKNEAQKSLKRAIAELVKKFK